MENTDLIELARLKLQNLRALKDTIEAGHELFLVAETDKDLNSIRQGYEESRIDAIASLAQSKIASGYTDEYSTVRENFIKIDEIILSIFENELSLIESKDSSLHQISISRIGKAQSLAEDSIQSLVKIRQETVAEAPGCSSTIVIILLLLVIVVSAVVFY